MIFMPMFSVVIPLYNKGLHIKKTIESVLSQEFQDYELIIVDDGSTDDGVSVVKAFNDSRIKLIQQSNQGVSAARNRGIKEARANFIAFLDADDEWLSCHLCTLSRLIKKYPCAGIYSTAYKISINEKLRWPKYKAIPSSPWEGIVPNYFKSVAMGEHLVCSSTACIPINVLEEIGFFPEYTWYGEDVYLFGKIALQYPVIFSWTFGAIYHWEAINRACKKTLPLEEEPFVKEVLKIMQEGSVSPYVISDLKEYIAKKEINRAKRYVDIGDNKFALDILRKQTTKYNKKRKLIVTLKAITPFFLFRTMRRIRSIFKKSYDS